MIEFEGQRYEMIRASEVGFDGMVLELWEANSDDVSLATGDVVLRAEYLDATAELTVRAFRDGLSAALVEWFTSHAWDALPPVDPAV